MAQVEPTAAEKAETMTDKQLAEKLEMLVAEKLEMLADNAGDSTIEAWCRESALRLRIANGRANWPT